MVRPTPLLAEPPTRLVRVRTARPSPLIAGWGPKLGRSSEADR